MSVPMLFRLAAMPGNPARANEDFAGVLGRCAILLDGSGAPGDLPSGCMHGVPWFVRQLGARCLAGMAVSEPDKPLEDVLAEAIREVSSLHRDTCDLSSPGTPSSMVVMTRTTASSLDYLVLGDSALVVDNTAGSIRAVTDLRMNRVAAEEYQAMLALPTGSPEHQAARIAFVRRQQPMRNQPGGYPVASTDPGAAAEALTGTIPAGDVRRAAMMSDGVTRFVEFRLGTWSDLLGILTAGGPSALFARIREAENGDPEGRKWPRAKQHDDVGVIFWERDSISPATTAEPAAARPEPQPVVAAVVTSPLGVLVGRRNDGNPPWTLIAGEIEPGESPADAAVREVKEETGCQVTPGSVIGRRVHPGTGRTMIYMSAQPVHGTKVFVGDSDELAEVRWVSLQEADELLPGMYEPVRDHLARALTRNGGD